MNRSRFLVSLFCVGAAAAQSFGTFTPTGIMTAPRFGHSATLLPDGKVLIAGGKTTCFVGPPIPCVAPSAAEVYDPVTGAFTATGNMSPADQRTDGLLLADGRVFFAGSNFQRNQAVIETYDPSAGSFTSAGNTASLTYIASATLLEDSRVLITGHAQTFLKPVYGAEIYDPADGTFTAVPNWIGQEPFASVALGDGRLLFQYYEDDAKIYDAASGQFSDAGGLFGFDNPPRASVLLNGNALFTGGNDIGGSEDSAELYDPVAGAFAYNMKMSIARDGHSSTLLPDGAVLLAGGLALANRSKPAVASAELYGPATGDFSPTGSLATGRAGHAAVLLNNGQVLITGGSTFFVASAPAINGMASAELYTPAVLVPAPALFSISGDGGQGAIWHASTGEIASSDHPAAAGEILSMYTGNLAGGAILPRVAVGGRAAKVAFFGPAPGYPGYYQVNFRVPGGVLPGPAVPVRLTYLGRQSNDVTIALQ